MEWVEFLSKGLDTPLGQFIVGVLVLVFGSTALFSEKTAKEKFGAFGMLARWIQKQKERAADLEEEIINRRTQDLWDEIKRVDEARKKDNKELKKQILELQRSEADQHAYIVWVTSVMRDLEIWAAEHGYKLPPPPFVTFTEWIRQYRREPCNREEDEDDEEPAAYHRPNMG